MTIQTNESKFAIYSVPIKSGKKRSNATDPAVATMMEGPITTNGNYSNEDELSLPVAYRKPPRVPQPAGGGGNSLETNGHSIPRKSPGGGKRSRRGMKIIDSEVEKHLLYGKETTL